MRFPTLPLLLLAAFAGAQAQAQTDPAGAAARARLFRSCGGVEADTLPLGIRAGLYRGTLGREAVTLELTGAGGDHADRYAYDRYGLDLPLERGRPSDRTAGYSLLAVEAVSGDDGSRTARGCLTLAADGDTLRGGWRNPDGGARLPLTLRRVQVAGLPLNLPASPGLLGLRNSDPFTFLKLNRPWTRVAGGLREPLSGVVYPRLTGGTAGLNGALQDRQLRLAAEGLGCLGNDRVNPAMPRNYGAVGRLSWRSPHLVSLREEVNHYCGGAYPDASTAGGTLDPRSGREVALAGKAGTVWPGLTPARMQALYLAGYGDGDPGCRELLAGEEGRGREYPAFRLFLTRGGLALWPSFLPHVALACAEVVTLPFSKLRPLADASGAYFHDLYAR